jgi:Na+-transporting NADH:ubiquinone oxidoreductase subunit C
VKSYLKMLWFVAVMGIITSGIFLGMEAWTRPLIAANAAIELRSTILDASDIPYTTATVNDAFEANVTVRNMGEYALYVDNNSGSISFEFAGSGVWGPISGVITLERDIETIKSVRVLQQEETPGLGGVVAEAGYLSQYRGVKMTPQLAFRTTAAVPAQPNEVDAITGATRTSDAFLSILNSSYTVHLEALKKVGE